MNVLNARPDRARNEAETIAQAGLPGTVRCLLYFKKHLLLLVIAVIKLSFLYIQKNMMQVTIATSMAGRGTDILLGGNPKGLTLTALKHFLLPVMVTPTPNLQEQLDEYQPPPPMFSLTSALHSEAEMKKQLPPVMFDAFREAKIALSVIQKEWSEAKASSHKKFNKDAATSSILAADDQKKKALVLALSETASEAAHNLDVILEEVEYERSVYLLHCKKQGQDPTNIENAARWIHTQLNDKTSSWARIAKLSRATDVLRRYALLQWLWFDKECAKYAQQVKAAGGLLVVITSLQSTRRAELQLRGMLLCFYFVVALLIYI